MTLSPELKQAVEKAGDEPVRVEDPETHAAYLIIREDVYRRMHSLSAIDHSDRSLYIVIPDFLVGLRDFCGAQPIRARSASE